MFPLFRYSWLPLGLILMSGQPVCALPSVITSPANVAGNLALDSQTYIVKVATLTLSTTNATGYTVSISSGAMTNSNGAIIPFQVAIVEPNSPAPGTGAFTVASGNPYTLSTVQANTVSKDLYIQYTPTPLQEAGSYSASIAVTIMDNP